MTEETREHDDAVFNDSVAQVSMLAESGHHSDARELARRLISERPQNAAAHAAMGDIYNAEGHWGDAVDWYELALNLSFDPVVMEKLAAARSNAIRQAAAPEPRASTARAPRAIPEIPAGEGRQHSQQIVGVVIAGVLVVTLLAFFLMRSGSRSDDGSSRDRYRADIDRDIYPRAAGQPATTAYQPPAGQSPGRPASGRTLEPAPASYQQAAESSDQRQAPRPAARSGPGTSAGRTAGAVSTRDQQILRTVRHSLRLNPEGREGDPVASFVGDDYSGVAILTIRVSATANTASLLEQEVLTSAYRSAAAAMKADSTLKSVIVRCMARVMSDKGQQEDVVIFRATGQRDHMKFWLDGNQAPSTGQIAGNALGDVSWDRAAVSRFLRAASAGPSG